MSDAQQPTPRQTDLEIARIVARAHERDRYLAALLAPARERDDLIVLAAFAGEVARIPPLVTEPLMGEIRLQWWRDALQNTTRAWKSGHPVADRMRETAARHHLPQGLLLGFIDAHAGQLYDTPLPDEAALKAYLAHSDGALFELGLRILGRSDDLSRELAAAAGQAYGLVRNLTELPALLAQGRMLIPADQLAAVGVSPGDLPNEGSIPQIAPVLAQLLAEARDALAAARRLYRALPRVQRVAVLPVALVEPYLRALENVERNPLRDVAELTPLQRIWPLFRSYWSGQL